MSEQGSGNSERSMNPAVMGDEIEEKSLNQAGEEAARITEGEVDKASEGDEEAGAVGDQEFWKGFAWGAFAAFVTVFLIGGRARRHSY